MKLKSSNELVDETSRENASEHITSATDRDGVGEERDWRWQDGGDPTGDAEDDLLFDAAAFETTVGPLTPSNVDARRNSSGGG